MKAIVINSGKTVDVEVCYAKDDSIFYRDHDNKTDYNPGELEFYLFDEPEEEVTIEGFVARDKVYGELNIFTEMPMECNIDSLQTYWGGERGSLSLPKEYENMFENLDSKTVQEVTITIKPKKK